LVGRFEVLASAVGEDDVAAGDAHGAVVELAERKARDVAARRPDALVIAADTLVVAGGETLGKPTDRSDAMRQMVRLTSMPHEVVTGLCVLAPDGRQRVACVATRLRMRRMSRWEISRHVDAPGALNRAGVYALQPDDPNVHLIEGSATAVMGLPMDELEAILHELYPEQW
jgi:septum formation protein